MYYLYKTGEFTYVMAKSKEEALINHKALTNEEIDMSEIKFKEIIFEDIK